MAKRVLLIAYHYPPVGISSGMQRTLSFSRYLADYGWEPLVLSADPRAYETLREDQLRDIPTGIVVKRAFALDARRHFAVAGSYPTWLAVPDRWVSWFPAGVIAGLRLIRRYRPSVIWSTFPIATAQLIALALNRASGLPWVADFRDPMTEPGYQDKPAHLWLEQQVVARAACSSFTTPSTMRMYAERYPQLPSTRWLVLPNGYDDEIFRSVEIEMRGSAAAADRPLTLVHSGLLYPNERDPGPFFAALARLKSSRELGNQRVVLRATGHDETYRRLLAEAGVADLVELAAPIPYRAALKEMLEADGLLIFQAASCNMQIPAKLYECLRAQRPILALTDSAGDTAAVLRAAGVDTIVPLDDAAAITTGLAAFIARVRAGTAPIPSKSAVVAHSRKALTAGLAACFDTVTSSMTARAASSQMRG
jgi:hypothetical protein